MDSSSFVGGRFWILRVDPGEDVLGSLKRFIREKGIRQGLVVAGYGTFARVRLHWVAHNRFPTENRFEEWEGGMELMGMNGMIVEGEPHVHFTASTPDGAFGGHLEEGCTCYVLCEITILELEGPRMRRETVVAQDGNGNSGEVPRLSFGQGA